MKSSDPFEASLTESGRYQLLVEAISDYAIYMLDPHGRVANWNAGAQRFKGYTAEEIVGQNFDQFYTDEDRAAGIPQRNLRLAAEEGRVESEGWRLRKDGTTFWAHVVIDRISSPDGRIVGFAKITRDLTERRDTQIQLEQAREALFQAQKMEAIGQLTGGIAHDFNNLLMAILGSLEIISNRLPPDPRITPYLENAIKGAQRGAGLTQRMLAFARRQELKMQAVDVIDLVHDMAGLIERSLGPGFSVRQNFPLVLPLARTDPNQLESALLNLVINARDAMPSGGDIVISAESRSEDGGARTGKEFVVLAVADQGEGMDEATLAKAMEPFYTTKGIGKGTGLGLPMVMGLAEQSGGKLVLNSRKGEGTRAEIWLPVAKDIDLNVEPEPTPPADLGERSLKVLAVDDDALVLLNTQTMLQDLGYEAIEAYSAKEALAILDREKVDLLLTDHAMPGMTGAELIAEARRRFPEIRVLLATGYAELPEGTGQGVSLLAKPFSGSELARAVAQVMR
jgi:PAS domain S-box-containing protein